MKRQFELISRETLEQATRYVGEHSASRRAIREADAATEPVVFVGTYNPNVITVVKKSDLEDFLRRRGLDAARWDVRRLRCEKK